MWFADILLCATEVTGLRPYSAETAETAVSCMKPRGSVGIWEIVIDSFVSYNCIYAVHVYSLLHICTGSWILTSAPVRVVPVFRFATRCTQSAAPAGHFR